MRGRYVMLKRSVILGALVALTVLAAAPAAANMPEVSTHVEEWRLDNPCTETDDEVVITGTSTLREHLHANGRFTQVQTTITGDGAWTGHGLDTGVELAQGETVSHRWMATNSETGQKIQFTIRGHFNENTGEWNTGGGPLFNARCVRP